MDAAELPALPDGWVWVSIGEIASINKRSAEVRLLDENAPVSFIPMAAIDAENGKIAYRDSRNLKDVKKGFTSFQNGDVLFAKITPCMENGKAAIANCLENGLGFGSTEFHVITPGSKVLSDWIYYFVRQSSFRSQAKKSFKGTAGQLRVPAAFINSSIISLPPLEIQKQTIAKIEELFTQLDAAEAALKRAKANLVRYRQSVLQAAVTGELTREWREAHAGQIEPARVLLERIRTERRAKWEADLRSRGKDPSKVKYEEPAAPDTSTLPDLPEGWVWGKLDQVGFIGTGATPLRSEVNYYSGGTIPWITSGSLNKPIITDADDYITELALKETNAKIYPIGTLLVAMYGEGKTRGKASVLAIEAATNQAIAAITILKEHRYLLEYVKLFLQYNYDNIRRLSAGGVQPNLNLSIVKNTQFPLPPREEQIVILSKIEELFTSMSFLEHSLSFELIRISHLRQSILENAFTGQLI